MRLAVVLAFCAVASLAAVVRYERSQHRAAMERLSRERSELHTRLEARELDISRLKSEIRNLRSLVASPERPRTISRNPAAPQAEAELRRQLAELEASHSNTLALAGSLLAEKSNAEALEESRKASESILAELESATNEAAQNAVTAREKADELLTRLNVPADVDALDAEAALASPNLRAFWPYFEARKERDTLERVAEALRLRLLQETVDAGTNPLPANPP